MNTTIFEVRDFNGRITMESKTRTLALREAVWQLNIQYVVEHASQCHLVFCEDHGCKPVLIFERKRESVDLNHCENVFTNHAMGQTEPHRCNRYTSGTFCTDCSGFYTLD